MFRINSLALWFATLTLLSSTSAVLGQSAPYGNAEANPSDPQDILFQLAPEDVPPSSLNLRSLEKARAIRLLRGVKRDETGRHRQLAIYLLATLGQDYERNRDALLRIWQGCAVKDSTSECTEDTADFLLKLYVQGHKELLRPLLEGGPNSDAALAEELGTFFADQLEKNPNGFLTALASFPPRQQAAICELGGGTDGGGMGPEAERKVLHNLNRFGGKIAARCAHSVRAGNKAAEDAHRDLMPDQPRE